MFCMYVANNSSILQYCYDDMSSKEFSSSTAQHRASLISVCKFVGGGRKHKFSLRPPLFFLEVYRSQQGGGGGRNSGAVRLVVPAYDQR